MKKKLALLLSMILVIISFAGCTSDQTEFYTKFKANGKAEANSVSMLGNMEVSISQTGSKPETVSMDMVATGYTNNKTMQGYVDLKMTDKTNTVTLPPMKMFIDKSKVYVNKEYFNEMFKDVPKQLSVLTALDADYLNMSSAVLGLDNIISDELISNPEYNELVYSMYEDAVRQLGIDIPVTKQGDTYTISMDENALVDQIFKSVSNGITNLDRLNRTLNLNLTDDQIISIKADYAKNDFGTLSDGVKAILKGTELKFTYYFKDDKTMNQTLTLKLPITIPVSSTQSIKVETKMKLVVDSAQVAAKSVQMPEKKADLPADFLIPQTPMLSVPTNEVNTMTPIKEMEQETASKQITNMPDSTTTPVEKETTKPTEKETTK